MRAPSPDLQTASNDESHEPLECLVRGTLHAPDAEEVGSADAAVRLSRTPRGWLQTNETATARHLRREYIGKEDLDTLIHLWLPQDFLEFAVEVTKCGALPWRAYEPRVPYSAAPDQGTGVAPDQFVDE